MAKGDYMGADISWAEADLLKPAIAELLRTIPESWAEFDLDRLTVVQDRALFLLTAAGMVERRGWLRSTIANHPTAFEVRFQATGEGGFAKAMEQAVATEYETWKEAWQTWKTGETKDVLAVSYRGPEAARVAADRPGSSCPRRSGCHGSRYGSRCDVRLHFQTWLLWAGVLVSAGAIEPPKD